MITEIDRSLLEKIADLTGQPVGAINIRKDGGCEMRQSTEHIKIDPQPESRQGIVIRILPGTELYEHAKKKGKIPADWNGIDSLYYFEDGLDRERVHAMLLEAFGNDPYVIYPPDRQNRILRTIHRIGYLKFRESVPGAGRKEGTLS